MFETATLSYGPPSKRVWTTFAGATGQALLVDLRRASAIDFPAGASARRVEHQDYRARSPSGAAGAWAGGEAKDGCRRIAVFSEDADRAVYDSAQGTVD